MSDELNVTYSVPDEFKEGIRADIAILVKLCPGWVSRLYVTWKETPPNERCTAEMRADYKYRNAQLLIYPAWITESAFDKRKTIVHEAAHILNAPMHECFGSMLQELFDNKPKVQAVMRGQWRIANEAATEDMAAALFEAANFNDLELAPLTSTSCKSPDASSDPLLD